MLTTKPYLRTRRPSPTTAEFIVSTRPPLTRSLRILLGLVYLARFLASLGVLLILYSTWHLSPYSPASSTSTTTTTITTTGNTNTDIAAGGGGKDNSPGTIATSPPSSSSSSSSPTTIITPALSLAALHHLLQTIQTSTSAGRLSARVAGAAPAWALAPACLCALYLLLATGIHTEERLLVLRGLGIQTSSSTGCGCCGCCGGGGGVGWLATAAMGLLLPGTRTGEETGTEMTTAAAAATTTTRFIPTEKIRDVLIAEAFRGFEVRHYLVVVVDGEEDVVVVFPRLLPRPRVLEEVWRGVRECLYEYEHGSGGGGGGGRKGAGRGKSRGRDGGRLDEKGGGIRPRGDGEKDGLVG